MTATVTGMFLIVFPLMLTLTQVVPTTLWTQGHLVAAVSIVHYCWLWRNKARVVHTGEGSNVIVSQCGPPKVYNYTLSGVLVGPVFTDGCYIDLQVGPDGRLYGCRLG